MAGGSWKLLQSDQHRCHATMSVLQEAMDPWSPEEIARLKATYTREPLAVVAKGLNRSQASVRLMASVLRLEKRRNRKPRLSDRGG